MDICYKSQVGGAMSTRMAILEVEQMSKGPVWCFPKMFFFSESLTFSVQNYSLFGITDIQCSEL